MKAKYKMKIHSAVMIYSVLLLILITSACVPRKKTILFQKIPSDTVINVLPPADYALQVGDILYIHVQSADEKAAAFINGSANLVSASSFSQSEQYMYFNGYEVTQHGNIILPYLDSIKVSGLNTDQVKQLISDSLKPFIIDPIVTVKLANFRVCVLGEVQNPGTFVFFYAKANIFDALALARPTEFSNAKNVVVTRLRSDNKLSVKRLDLTSADIITSEYYYLQPNDQIYIEPLRIKKYGFSNFPYATILSAVSTIVLIYSVFK